jgi:hypothetical protein
MVNLPSRLQVATLTTADIIALRMLFHDARQVTLAWLKRQPPVGIARLCHDLSLFWVKIYRSTDKLPTAGLPPRADVPDNAAITVRLCEQRKWHACKLAGETLAKGPNVAERFSVMIEESSVHKCSCAELHIRIQLPEMLVASP